MDHHAEADASIAKYEEDEEDEDEEEEEGEEEPLPAVQRLIRGEWPVVVAAATTLLKGLVEAIVAGAEGMKAQWTKPLRSMGKSTRKRLMKLPDIGEYNQVP
jgi:hypothetical protein